jgi:2-haloalkanoic acid dehalogenase type II
MPRRYDIITFDCYGTLIDWEAGIAGAFLEFAAAGGVTLSRDAVLASYMRHEPLVQAEEYRTYRDVLTETALRVAKDLNWFLSPSDAPFLAASLPSWPPFPDTAAALRRLALAGHRLGILSNVDDDLLAGTRRNLGVELDETLVITAEAIGSYKPARAHFIEARERASDAPWLHAAQSYFHDVIPARSLGVPVAWVNRKGELSPDGSAPTLEVRTLEDLADRLT